MTILQSAPKTGGALFGLMVGCAVALMPALASAQITIRPATPPILSAEHERWYVEGEAIPYWGNVYYPTGATVFFNPYEMIRSGDYRGIPLYTMKTRAPYDMVYVPVAGGLLQPYERRRDGEVAGTVGSSAPSFPVDRDSETPTWDFVPQAAGPAMLRQLPPYYASSAGVTLEHSSAGATDAPAPTPTPGATLATALRPTGLNAFYVDYNGRRWFSSGPVVLLQPSSFTRAGEYYGFPVYVGRDDDETIYVTVADAALGLLTPYSLRK